MRDRQIQLAHPDGRTASCDVAFCVTIGNDRAATFTSELGHFRFVEADFFECLRRFREQVEPTGWRVLVNGARRDAWPSGMARDMAAGLRLYLLRKKPLGPDDVVDTLDPATPGDVVDYATQARNAEAFFGTRLREPSAADTGEA